MLLRKACAWASGYTHFGLAYIIIIFWKGDLHTHTNAVCVQKLELVHTAAHAKGMCLPELALAFEAVVRKSL